MSKYHGYKILVGVSPNVLPLSLLIVHCSHVSTPLRTQYEEPTPRHSSQVISNKGDPTLATNRSLYLSPFENLHQWVVLQLMPSISPHVLMFTQLKMAHDAHVAKSSCRNSILMLETERRQNMSMSMSMSRSLLPILFGPASNLWEFFKVILGPL